jgi:ABC-type phosphate/phosphonate transport system substrate-binding protein
MRMRRFSLLLALTGLLLTFTVGFFQPTAAHEAKKKPSLPELKIGLIKSLLVASNSSISMAAPLGATLGAQMGCRLDFVQCEDHTDMAKKLQNGEIQLGVIHGLEYCWLRKDAPEIEPLALALGHDIKLQAKLLVRADDHCTDIRALKDKTLLRPTKTLNHNNLYLTKVVSEVCPQCDSFFGSVKVVGSLDATVDALIDGQGQVMVIDSASWAIYQQQKPGRAKKVRVLAESGWFPTAAVLHRPGSLEPDVLNQIKTGFLTVHQKPLGQQMLVFWRLTRFVPVSEEYQDVCRKALEDYPFPMMPASFQANKK